MFLDDKLTEIWEDGRDNNERVVDTLQNKDVIMMRCSDKEKYNKIYHMLGWKK